MAVAGGGEAWDASSEPLDRLVLVMPPRSVPPPPSRSWEEAEEALGLEFAPSLRTFLDTYGPGSVGDELRIFDPRDEATFRSALSDYHGSMRLDMEFVTPSSPGPPFPPWPADETSLLVVAADGSGVAVLATVRDGFVDDEELWINEHEGTYVPVDGPLWSLVLAAVTSDLPITVADVVSWDLRPVYRQDRPDRPAPMLPPASYGSGADDALADGLPAPLVLLHEVLRPPERPAAFPHSWDDVERRFALRFSLGIVELVDAYGDGVAYPIDWVKPRSALFEEVLVRSAADLEGSTDAHPAPLPPFLPGSDGLLRVAASRLSPEQVYVEVQDGVADDARLWIARARTSDWVAVPGPLSALLLSALADIDMWGVGRYSPRT